MVVSKEALQLLFPHRCFAKGFLESAHDLLGFSIGLRPARSNFSMVKTNMGCKLFKLSAVEGWTVV